MALSTEDLQAIVATVLAAMAKQPPARVQPISEAERPKVIEFISRTYPRSQHWSEPNILASAVEIDGPRVIPGSNPPATVMQLHHIPVEALRRAMREEEETNAVRAAQQKLAQSQDNRDRKAG
jgi:hypothetical protein